jgi:hypothetical protein
VFLVILLSIMFIGWDIEAKFNMGEASKHLLDHKEFLSSDTGEYIRWRDIQEVNDLWDWTDKALVPALFPPAPNGTVSLIDGKYVTPYARSIGTVRFRQLRTAPRQCLLFKRMKRIPTGFNAECYDDYIEARESKVPFGLGPEPYTWSSADATGTFRWRSVSELILYGAGGFVVDIPVTTEADFRAALQTMRSQGYLDRGTRAIFINLNMYHPSLRRYHSIQLLAEFLVSGNIIVLDQKFRTFRVDLYETPLDTFRTVLEVIFILFVSVYTTILIKEMYAIWSRRQVFSYGSRVTFWHWVDSIGNALFISGIGLRLFIISSPTRRRYVDGATLDDTTYIALENLASLDYTFDSVMAASVALSFFKMFKFLQVSQKLSLIWRVLSRSAPNMLGFLVFFIIVFIAFVIMGYIIFGPEIREFRSFGVAFSTMGRMVFGSFDYEPLSFTQPYIAPVFFYLFMVLVYFILLNMFLAILNDTYQYIMDEYERKLALRKVVRKAPLGKRIVGFFKEVWARLRGKTQLQASIRSFDHLLKSSKFTEEEIINRFRRSIVIRTKEKLTLSEIQAALGDDAPANLAEMIMQNFIDSGEILESSVSDLDKKMDTLLGFDMEDAATKATVSRSEVLDRINHLTSLLAESSTALFDERDLAYEDSPRYSHGDATKRHQHGKGGKGAAGRDRKSHLGAAAGGRLSSSSSKNKSKPGSSSSKRRNSSPTSDGYGSDLLHPPHLINNTDEYDISGGSNSGKSDTGGNGYDSTNGSS